MPYDDGIYVSYINTAVDDGSEIAALMRFFKKADPYDDSQGELSKRIHFLKCEEGGRKTMCEITEQFFQEGRTEGRAEERLAMVRSLIKNTGCSIKQALKILDIPENELAKYTELLEQ